MSLPLDFKTFVTAPHHYTDSSFSISPDEGDILYKGVWYVYDVTVGKKVEGATGTQYSHISAYGNHISYYDDNDNEIVVNADGEKLSEDTILFDNGCYTVEESSEGVMYDTDGNKLFTYDSDMFSLYSSDGEYFLASKYESGESAYVFLDKNGKVASAEFKKHPSIVGEFVLSDDKLCDFNGKQVIEGSYDYVYFDEQSKSCYILENDDATTIMKNDGTVIYTGTESDDLSFETYSFLVRKTIDDEYFYYSLKDKDFTLKGYGIAPWIVEVDGENYESSLADVISGETIIEGYRYYSDVIIGDELYIYAEKDDGVDIYTIKY